ncbi:MAG: MaoC/PaaZ C-terminal domain-containing protein [Hyphomicrobiales bacterium]
MDPFKATIGASVTCSKTVGESDVYLFAGITGDLSSNHVDEVAMASTRFGGRIAHGALLVGYMSRASTMITDRCEALMREHYPVSLGYDRVRFLEAVKVGDTITVTYRIVSADPERMRTVADVSLANQSGTVCAVAGHITRWLKRET